MGENSIEGFKISAAEIQKWKDGMRDGVKKKGKIVGKIRDTTAGIYLRACRAVWNTCLREGYLKDVPYPFSNRKEKGLVSIPTSGKRRKYYLRVSQMTELYNLFLSKQYPETWGEHYTKMAHYSLGLFLVQYLCNGFNMADAARLKYDTYYFQNGARLSVSIGRRLQETVRMVQKSSSPSSSPYRRFSMKLQHLPHAMDMYFLRFSMVRRVKETAG